MIDVDDETTARVIRVSLLAVFVVSVLTMNVVNVVDGMLLDSSHTTESFEDEDVYSQLTVELQRDLAENISTATTDEMNATRLAESTLTEEYTRRVVNNNVADVHAFLQGDRGTTDIRWNLTGVQRQLAAEVDEPRVSQEMNATIPEAVIIQEDISTGPLGQAKRAIAVVPLLLGLCIAGAFFVLGLYAYRLRSPEQIAVESGIALTIAGVTTIILSVLSLFVLQFVSLSLEGNVQIDPSIVFDGVVRAVESTAYSLIWQSLFIASIGLILVALGRTNGIRSGLGLPSTAASDE